MSEKVKHANTVQVKHVNVIPLFHFFQASAAHDWQPAESTIKCSSFAKSMKWTIIIKMWLIIIQPQIFLDKYLQCVFVLKWFFFRVGVHVGSERNCWELYSSNWQHFEQNNGHNGTKSRKIRPMLKIRAIILKLTASSISTQLHYQQMNCMFISVCFIVQVIRALLYCKVY